MSSKTVSCFNLFSYGLIKRLFQGGQWISSEFLKRWKNKTCIYCMYLVEWSQFEKPLKLSLKFFLKIKIAAIGSTETSRNFKIHFSSRLIVNWQIKSSKSDLSTWIEIWTLNFEFLHYLYLISAMLFLFAI